MDSGRSARSQGYKFKIVVPVHANRSVETSAKLLDADDNVLLTFPVRAHGHDVTPSGQPDPREWPDYDNDNAGLNQFSSSGMTPTGLSQADLNSPEDDPKLYGCVCVHAVFRACVCVCSVSCFCVCVCVCSDVP